MTTPRAPLRLHGYPVSNYHNIVHAVLLEKGAAHDVVIVGASKDADFLARNPMGKIPYLETPEGFLAETVAIIDYIEDTLPEPALVPADPFARARVRQLINIVQVYVEGACRSLYPGVFMGGENAPVTKAMAQANIDRAIGAIVRLTGKGEFLTGAQITLADIFAFHCFELAERVMQFSFGRSLLAETGLRDWRDMMARRPSSQVVLAAFGPVFADYLRNHGAAYPIEDHTHA